MSYLLPVLALLLAAGLISSFLGLRFEHAMPVALMSIALILYTFYIAGALHVGFVVVIAAIGLGAVVNLVRIVRGGRLKTLRAAIVTPQVATFAIVCVVSYIATRQSTAGQWDELRLWAAYPKILHDSGTLQLGGSADLFAVMQPYQPGMPLISFFFGEFSAEFHEPMLFFAYAVTATVFLLPVSRLLTWKRFVLIPLAAGLVIGVVLYFWNSNHDSGNFFGSLFVDTYLGLLAGYGCYVIASGAVARASGIVAVAVTSAMLYTVKETGLLFGVVLIAAAVVQMFIAWRHAMPRSELAKKLTLRTLVLAVPLMFVTVSWKQLLGANGLGGATLDGDYAGIQVTSHDIGSFAYGLLTRSLVTPRLTVDGGLEQFFVGLSFFSFCIVITFWLAGRSANSWTITTRTQIPLVAIQLAMVVAASIVVVVSSNGGAGGFSYALLAAIAGAIAISLFLRLKSEASARESRDYAIGLIAAVVMNIGFVIGLFVLTTVAFGGVLASFGRYMSTVGVLCLTFLTLFLTSRSWGVPRGAVATVATSIIAMSLAVLVFLFPLRATERLDGGWDSSAAQISSSILRDVSQDRGEIGPDSKVHLFLVFTGDPFETAGLHHRIYFDLLGTGIIVRNFYTETRIATSVPESDPAYSSAVADARSAFEAQLVAGRFDYVFVVQQDDSLVDQFGTEFTGGLAQNALYRVENKGLDVSLIRVP